jgi:hypothetical protein
MPCKLTRLSYYSVIKPEDGDEVDDYDLVRATLAILRNWPTCLPQPANNSLRISGRN